MWNDAYLESAVHSADPIGLTCLVYGCAIDSVRTARRHLLAGDIARRSQAISRAMAAVAELEGSLDHCAGGTLSRRLEELYRYVRQRLTEGNMLQQDSPLAEAESLLETLAEAWKGLRGEPSDASPAPPTAAPPIGPWAQPDAGSHAWSA